jgi:hypothetical protein
VSNKNILSKEFFACGFFTEGSLSSAALDKNFAEGNVAFA